MPPLTETPEIAPRDSSQPPKPKPSCKGPERMSSGSKVPTLRRRCYTRPTPSQSVTAILGKGNELLRPKGSKLRPHRKGRAREQTGKQSCVCLTDLPTDSRTTPASSGVDSSALKNPTEKQPCHRPPPLLWEDGLVIRSRGQFARKINC